MIGDAQRLVMDSDNLIRKLAIGTALVILSIFILPAILVLGYLMKVIESAETESQSLPEWKNFTSIFLEGLKGLAVILIYLVPVIILGSLAVADIGVQAVWGSLAAIYILAYHYFMGSALRQVATKNTFNPVEAVSNAATIRYGVTILWITLLAFITNGILFVLIISIVGIIALPLLIFWFYVMVAAILGIGFSEIK